MLYYIILFSVCSLVLGVLKVFFNKTITWKEFAIAVASMATVTWIDLAIIEHADLYDTETRNGYVVEKHAQNVSCEHSYQCNCRQVCSGSGKNRSCSTVCSTCYEHSFDRSWYYQTTDDGTNTISRVDRQGLIEPKRWTAIQIGEPSSSKHSYKNYFKADPESVLLTKGDLIKYKDHLPDYPQVYDYYRINQVIAVNFNMSTISKDWYSYRINEINRDLGAKKQVNAMIVVVKDFGRDYFHALNEHWLGGKKNDAIFVIGVKEDFTLNWVEVMALNETKQFNIAARNKIMELGNLSGQEKDLELVKIIREQIEQSYVRTPMSKYEYLMNSYTPSTFSLILSVVILISLSFGISWFFHKNEVA